MSRLIILLLGLTLFLPTLVTAGQAQPAQLQAVAAALEMAYPSIPLKQLNPTPIEGVFEIITQKDEILYFAPRTSHILVGELWSSSGQNLTRESKNQLMTKKLALFPLDKALKIGDGPNQVVEVSDPDCPFCRDGSAFFSARADVTRYIFLFPLDRLHPQADGKARYILSAEDPKPLTKKSSVVPSTSSRCRNFRITANSTVTARSSTASASTAPPATGSTATSSPAPT